MPRRVLPPPRSRNPLVRFAYWVSRRRYGHVPGPGGVTAHHPLLLAGWATFELALERADRMDRPLEELAATGASVMTGCSFCIDFAYGLLPKVGVPAEKAAAVADWRKSPVFDDDERLVLEYAEA